MNEYANSLKQTQSSLIREMSAAPAPYVKNPEKDFILVSLTSCHAKNQETFIQEIFARMIMYNFAEMISSHVVISQLDKQHQYQVNFTVAVHVCRHYLRSGDDEPPPDVETLIAKTFCRFDPFANGRRIRAKSSAS